MSEKKYVYCNVLPENYQQPYLYIADMDVKAGDIVVISIKHQSKETQKVGLVLDVNTYTEANAPYPVQYTKHIKRIFSEEDSKDKDLAAQKVRLVTQNAHLMLSEEQKDKKDIKENLLKQGFHRNEIAQTNLYLQNLIRNMADTARSSSVSAELSGGVILSEDGKTVVQYIAKHNKTPEVVIIPSGVEKIEDGVFNKAKFTKLVINKELKELGQFTLYNKDYSRGPSGLCLKPLKKIEVESGNEIFCADEHALYRFLEDGTKELVFLYDTSVKSYETPKGISSISDDAFQLCDNLESVVLGEDIRVFNEYSLYEWHKLKSIYIPKTVEEIIARGYPIGLSNGSVLYYEIDEENPYVFKDDDCIYQVLDDGTYKLVVCNYYGKGAPTILDGTSVIGENAFYGCEGFSKIDFPKSVKTIEGRAFCHCNFKTITIPETIQRIEAGAFSCCNELKKICINHELEYVAEDAFSGCSWDLQKITSSSKQPLYSFKNGEIRKLSEKKSVPQPSQIMKKITDELNGWTFSDSTTEKAVYDSNTNTILLNFELDLRSNDAALVKERVECAETLKVNDQVFVRVPDASKWEIVSKSGKSVGQLNFLFVRQMWVWFNMVKVESATITKVTPKSQRKGAKYALVSIKMVLAPNEVDSNASEEEKKLHSQFAYTIDDNEARVLQWIGSDEDKSATIPAMIGGKKVKRLLPGVFRGDFNINPCNIEELIVSEGIERLEHESIFGLDKLKKVVLPNTIKYISEDVFSQIDGENEYRDLYLNGDIVFVAPKGSYAEKFLMNYKPQCWGAEYLRVVNDDSAETQRAASMQKCFEFSKSDKGFSAKMKQSFYLDDFNADIVYVPDSFNNQPVVAFDLSERPRCVKKFVIPKTVTKLIDIDTTVMFYRENTALCEVEIDEENPKYWSDGKAIYSKDKKILYRMLGYDLTEYTVHNDTQIIDKYAFGELKNLKTITLSANVKVVKDHAFSECKSLESIYGLDNVTSLGENLFSAYGWGTSDIPYLKNNTVMIAGNTLIKYHNIKERSYCVPETIELIDKNAFSITDENDELEEIIIPNTVRTIRSGAFSGRTNLKKVVLPQSIKEIEGGLFSSCDSLERITIPASVEKIDIRAFPCAGYRTSNVSFKEIIVEPDNKVYCSVNGMLLSKDCSILYYVPNALDLSINAIPLEVKEIASNAVAYNQTRDSFVLPVGLTTIGENAFAHMEHLRVLDLPNTVRKIGKYAFIECSNLDEVIWSSSLETIGESSFAKTALTQIVLPESVKTIGNEAFAETKAERVKMPKSVTKLGWGVYSGCKEIEIYDTIDPSANDCDKAIDTMNGRPNSNVGYIGIGPAWAMWECAANHRWYDYTIIVRSAETEEVKYKVWMGADSTQRQYYCQLASSWGKNATFSFKDLDEFFPKIRGTEHKVKVAKLRLEYPVALSDEMKKKYESYLSRYGKEA